MTPAGIIVDSPDTDIAVTGGPFIPSSEVLFEGTPLPTTVIDAQTLGTRFEATRLTLSREAELLVRNRGPAGNTVSSDPVLFAIGGPAPIILTLSGVPGEVVVGGSGFDVTLKGSGFVDGASLEINGKSRSTTFVDETSIVGTVLPEDLSLAGSVKRSAVNPSPTVGPSNEKLFTVLNPFAGLLSVSPTLIVARPDQDAEPVSMTLVGFNFVDGAVMFLGTTELPTQFQNSTTLFAEIPATLLKDGGAQEITVTNPDPVVPRVPVSETLPIMVLNPVPVLESVTIAPVFFDDNVPNTLGGDHSRSSRSSSSTARTGTGPRRSSSHRRRTVCSKKGVGSRFSTPGRGEPLSRLSATAPGLSGYRTINRAAESPVSFPLPLEALTRFSLRLKSVRYRREMSKPGVETSH